VKTVNLALGAMSEAVFKISPELEHLIMPGIHKKAVSIAKFLKSSKRTGRVRE